MYGRCWSSSTENVRIFVFFGRYSIAANAWDYKSPESYVDLGGEIWVVLKDKPNRSLTTLYCFVLQLHFDLKPYRSRKLPTLWKFQDFSITQFLREINLGNSISAKYAFLTHLQALNFEFYDFWTFWKVQFTKLTKFWDHTLAKTAVLGLLDSPKQISRKVWMTEKSWNLYTVLPEIHQVVS